MRPAQEDTRQVAADRSRVAAEDYLEYRSVVRRWDPCSSELRRYEPPGLSHGEEVPPPFLVW